MNLLEQQIEKKAKQYARNLLKQAAENEPGISADLQAIAPEVMAEIIDLENWFKTEKSLTRKIAEKSIKYSRKLFESGYSLENATEEAIKKTKFGTLGKTSEQSLTKAIAASILQLFLHKDRFSSYNFIREKVIS